MKNQEIIVMGRLNKIWPKNAPMMWINLVKFHLHPISNRNNHVSH
ncbi:unnamed protein product [Schistosoma curassoni]|uniref:Uncharacterized protein n=1 Tax=Schistosoma curassoni TaxID=6186 RepID=A0A183JJ17_9TREM|nr:unnamed protein product [Schistosoma curassoni]